MPVTTVVEDRRGVDVVLVDPPRPEPLEAVPLRTVLDVDDEPFDPVGTELPGSTVWVAPPVAAVVVVPWRAIAE